MKRFLFAALATACASPMPTDKVSDSGTAFAEGLFMMGDLEITPDSVDFGIRAPGSEYSEELLFRNTGDKALGVSSIYLDGSGAFSLAGTQMSFDIEPGESETVTVLFTPVIEEEYSATLNILVASEAGVGQLPITASSEELDSGAESEEEIVTEEGDGSLVIDLEEFDFGEIAKNTTATVTANLTNNTGQDVYISDITSSVPVFGYSEYSNTLPNTTISAGMTRSLLLTFTPTEEVDYNGFVTVQSDNGPILVSLSGTGVCTICAPDINIFTGGSAQDVMNQFSASLFNNPDSQTLSISNTGDEPLEIYSFQVQNDSQPPSLFCGTNASFSTTASSAVIAPGGSQSFDVELYYSGDWSDEQSPFCGIDESQNSLVIQSNDPDEGTMTVRLGGTVSPF